MELIRKGIPIVNHWKTHRRIPKNDGKSMSVNSFHFHPRCSVVSPTTSCALSRPLECYPTTNTLSRVASPQTEIDPS